MKEAADGIIVLADHTASYRVAGIPQVERVLREIERSWRQLTEGARPAPPVTLLWSDPAARDGQTFGVSAECGLPVRHVLADPGGHLHAGSRGAEPGKRAVVSTREVWPPGGLRARLSVLVPIDASTTAVASGRADPGEPVAVLEGPGDVPAAERALFRALGKPTDGYVTRLVNRRLSTPVSRLLSRTAATPHHVSAAVAALFVAAAACLAASGSGMILLGTVLYKAGDLLDGCDGELARVKFMESRLGAWLDTTIDMVGNMLFMGALGIGLSRQAGLDDRWRTVYLSEGLLTVGAMALVVWGMAWYTRATTGAAHFAGFGTSMAGSLPERSILRRVVLILSRMLRRDAYSWAFVGLAIIGRPAWILHAQVGGLTVYVLGLGYAGRRRHLVASPPVTEA